MEFFHNLICKYFPYPDYYVYYFNRLFVFYFRNTIFRNPKAGVKNETTPYGSIFPFKISTIIQKKARFCGSLFLSIS